MGKNTPKEISNFFSEVQKRRHKINPLPKEHYQNMQKKSVESKRKKIEELSTGNEE